MVFTVRLILVVTLLLTTCASVPAAQRRSQRRSVPEEVDAPRNTTSPNLKDPENTTSLTNLNDDRNSVTENAVAESKPKTETNSSYTIATRKTQSRGNARYFTEKINITNATEKPGSTSQTHTETSSNAIETQLQDNTDKKLEKHAKGIAEGEKAESSKAARRPEKLQLDENDDDNAESTENAEASRKLKKPDNLIQDGAKNEDSATKKSTNTSLNVIATRLQNNTERAEDEQNDAATTENTQTTRRNATSRSLSMDIEKYVSPEFHNNKNNFYTSPLFPDIKKYMSFGKDFTGSIKSTSSFEANPELTTPRNHFFDSKFQAVRDDVSESLKGIDESFKYNRDVETTEALTKEEVNSAKFNDTKGEVDYKKFLHLEASESKTRNRIHKDYLTEKGVRLDLVSNYSDTRIIDDDGTSEGLNKIPVTGVGVQYKDMENQESKKIVAENPPPNKTDSDAETSALTNKIETEYTKSTQSVLAVNIDPIRSSKANAINVVKRGSTKTTPTETSPDDRNELVTVTADSNYEMNPKGKSTFEEGSTKKMSPEITSVKPDENELAINRSTGFDYQRNSGGNTINTFEKTPDENELVINKSTVTPITAGYGSKENSITRGERDENEVVNKSARKENLVISTIKSEQVKLSMPADVKVISSGSGSVEKEARENENAINAFEKEHLIEPSVDYGTRTVLDGTKERPPNQVTVQEYTTTTTQRPASSSTRPKLSLETTLEYPRSTDVKLMSAVKRGSTKMAKVDVDHEYFELTPVTMKARTEQPNEILPIEMVSEKSSTSTEISSTEGDATELTSALVELSSTELPVTTAGEDFTEDLETATELTEIFNVSYPSTESDGILTSTLPYSTEQSTGDNTSYYAASDDDSTLMYEVTTFGNCSLDDVDLNETYKTTSRSNVEANNSFNDPIKQNEISGEEDGKKVVPLNASASSESPEMEDDLNPDDPEDDYVENSNRKVNQSDMGDLEGEGEHVTVTKTSPVEDVATVIKILSDGVEEATTQTARTRTNNTIIKSSPDDEEDLEATTTDILGLTGSVDEDNSGKIAAIVISSVGAVCLLLLAGLLIVMRKRQKRFNYGQRCRPVSLDAYSMDNVSICNTVGRRKGVLRASKRSYGNPAFDDPATVSHPLNFFGLSKFAGNLEDIKAEFEEIPQVTTRTNELPEGCDVKNRYANVIPLPETRVFLNYIDGYPNSDYINANYVRGAKGARHYYVACQAPMQNTIDDFWRMIWEQQTKVILMLTNLFENGIEKCADYLPPSEVLDCHRLFGDFQVTLKKREVKDKYIISILQLKNMVSNSWREVTHLWYLEWPDKGVPEEANSIIAFLIEARSYMKSGSASDSKTKDDTNSGDSAAFELSPVVIHCSPGTGRTGTVIGCDIAIREFELSRQVDVPKIVYKIRRDRASSVQTKEQYAFIYKVINLYATKLTGGALDSI